MIAKSFIASFLFLCFAFSGVKADGCSEENGYYYCNQASEVEFTNVGYSSTYNEITNMDTSSCSCSSTPKSYGGNLAPFDEEFSFHFRGPIELKRFAVYYPDTSNALSSLRKRSNNQHMKRHPHHKRDDVIDSTLTVYETVMYTTAVYGDSATTPAASEAQASSDILSSLASLSSASTDNLAASVTPTTVAASVASSVDTDSASATISSVVDSATSSVSTVIPSSIISAAPPDSASESTPASTSYASSTTSATSTSTTSGSSGSSDWGRSSFYEADSGTSDNIVFLNNMGGSAGSGVWSSCFGNSLSFAASNGVDGASSSQVLENILVASDKEFSIWTATECNNDCGYYLPGIPAYHGFSGAKLVLMEFIMPHDSSSSYNQDMPAIWSLNAQIPRTLQYGNADCSCWTTGCGEFDIFEVLSTGNEKMIPTLHGSQGSSNGNGGGAGSSDYFARPTSSSMIGAVIYDTSSSGIYIIDVTDQNVSFDSTYSASDVDAWLQSGATIVQLSS
ncbi:hypothetical protein POMI540_3594 [Schizosaccharomyces pombe]|uniref:Probable circularly permuted 1,3-beta-glucanase P23A10.11c YJL171C n=1 Tax=Schizosaccharomyces pombe (strain 972 / ATCC 24843) TaxID=284812 RepID=YH6B_SCHPO|nr:putative circularly permuted 1,3-beta-glucanase [Schizosaccharomyces pombe]Q9P7X4.1 RecName: Full=Probable circularly permuted 1,3-beta-glucanase P23A10.11c YJL171C; Flags: Precursor [Schizosaccharomyces pombe 972h-]CAB66439.1 circularly permuted 1,3-beta-glucanase (predicted) [Schizosaccharomyces pombe]|eukprot:NP_595823.1 putative circularly permuted 1,3-beta-glucanase [Schizosaccharomyces pombe]